MMKKVTRPSQKETGTDAIMQNRTNIDAMRGCIE